MVIDATWYEKPADKPERTGAGGVVIRLDHDQPLMALARPDDRPHFILPKGGVKNGETLLAAARREIHEEIGLSGLHFICDLGVCERLNFKRTRWSITHYFLFAAPEPLLVDQESAEFELFWHPVDDLPTLFWPDQLALIQDNLHKMMSVFEEAVR